MCLLLNYFLLLHFTNYYLDLLYSNNEVVGYIDNFKQTQSKFGWNIYLVIIIWISWMFELYSHLKRHQLFAKIPLMYAGEMLVHLQKDFVGLLFSDEILSLSCHFKSRWMWCLVLIVYELIFKSFDTYYFIIFFLLW